MSFKTCEACGLKSRRNLKEKRAFLAKFPRDEARCKQWVKIIGKSDLAYVPIEKLHTLKYVCGKHFRPKDFNKKKTNLRKTAIPSLLINREPLKDDILEEFPLHIAKEHLTIKLTVKSSYDSNNEHNYFKLVTSERERLHCQEYPILKVKGIDSINLIPTILKTVADQTSNDVYRLRSCSGSPSIRTSHGRSHSPTTLRDIAIHEKSKLEEQEGYILSSQIRKEYDRHEIHSQKNYNSLQRDKWPTTNGDNLVSPVLESGRRSSGQNDVVNKSSMRDRSRSPTWDIYRGSVRDNQRHIKSQTIERDGFPVLNNMLPDFDPLRKEQPFNAWLAKVEECANIHRWNEPQIIHHALSKLSGQAKLWYQNLPSRKRSWIQWKALLTETFSASENYADLLTEMLGRKTRVGESFESYYHSKINLLNHCKIFNKNAVDCLIHGIDDRSIRVKAEAADFEKPEQVLQFFQTLKVQSTDFKSNYERHKSSTNNNTSINRLNNKVSDQGQVYLWANWA